MVGDWRSSGATQPSLRPIGRGEGNLVLLAARAKRRGRKGALVTGNNPLPRPLCPPRAAAAPSKRSPRFPPAESPG